MRPNLDNIQIEINNFHNSNWKSAIQAIDRKDYSSIWQAFSGSASQAMEEDRQAHGKVLWLLADACSMMLKPSSVNAPFRPFAMFEERRSAIPEDFTESDIIFFSQIVNEVDDIWLRARLADLVWLLQRKLGTTFALTAINAYRSIPLDKITWFRGGRECWGRAISLALTLKEGAGNCVTEIELAIITAFESTKLEDGFFSLQLAEFLLSNRLCRIKGIDIALKLASLAHTFDSNGDLWNARSFFGASAKWFQLSGDKAKAAEMTANIAEGWVKEAFFRIASENPSYLLAASFYENAIQTYRTISRSERPIFRVDERIAELRTRMNEAGEKSLHEMGTISSPPIGITDLVESARNDVRGKSTLDALSAFANIYQGAKEAQTRESSEKTLREYPLSALFASTHLSRDGRVIARGPGVGFCDTDSDYYQTAVWEKMIHSYHMQLSLVVQGCIWPALEILLLEHRLREEDFVALAGNSPIVPKGREQLFGKALFAGYEKDFKLLLAISLEAGASKTGFPSRSLGTSKARLAMLVQTNLSLVYLNHLCWWITH